MDLPLLPASVRNAGDTVKLPEGELKDQAENTDLITEIRLSELKNARAVNSCKAYYGKARKAWASKPSA